MNSNDRERLAEQALLAEHVVVVAVSPCNVGITKTRARLRRAGWGV